MRLATLLFCLALPAGAQSPEVIAQDAMAQLDQAQASLVAAQSKGERVKALTDTVRAYESGIIALNEGLRQVAAEQTELETALEAETAELSALIAALQSIGRTPIPVLQAHPDGALAAARAGGVLADLTPAVRRRAATLRQRLDRLAGVRSLRAEALQTLRDGLAGAQDARSALGQAISDRTEVPQRFSEDPVQTTLLLATSQTLDAFANGLLGAVPASDITLSADGNLALPVAGKVLADDGTGRPGVRIATQPRALVTTPVQVTVLFEGELLDYSHVAILEPSAGILFVIAGMETSFATVGEILPQGAPVGLMGGQQQQSDAELSQNSQLDGTATRQTLYLEVRDGQAPVNPAAWFALEVE
ncbi:murein hydrolase activator EnvC family protein [Yoonia sediminilitoris]|uniref:Septal ring factor EnvC (AmiA/AmiB activator) n=1 Tax=Yoonia sediminilitoris TaxID=1286148 RepID=A0A2T6KPI0_9RHOB|nr:peptidoglycan DD-metalloendopeptidase family protein [Yoonia sediminilitoris]PUB18469.1 septal ring factor EnvC (AmiA/AmiB activator) [Yoonia sediminilitoris]RCW98637.1 septal ring factor EnvC (AmiA/AmiB activator) [Yoonia sediminilitoris]